ncbi:MAG: oligoendopeptidase F family protein, partial [Chlorobium sp.]|nr:oligoendopeptidase F family protein [Chlorobium sp.]
MKVLFLSLIVSLFFIGQSFAQNLERSQVEEKYKWNLSEIYSSKDAWQKEVNKISAEIDKLPDYKGKLGDNADTFYSALKLFFGILKSLYATSTYSNNLSNEDLNNSANQSLDQQITSIGTKFGEKTAFLEPEILTLPKEMIQNFFKEKPELEEFSMYIDNIQRLKAHTLSEPEEKILASFGLVAGNQNDVYGIFTNAEKPAPEITISTGEKIQLTPASYTKYRALTNRADRENVMETFFDSYGDFKNTFGANLGGKVKMDWVYAKDRKYESSLEAALSRDNLPVSVYLTLIDQINKNLPTLYRFLDLKKRMLGVSELHYYDLYVPLVEKVELTYSIEEGQKIISNALKLLGEEYINTLKKAFGERWIDYIPTVGKRSGAYSTGGAYNVHPYILMNWNDDYESVSTLAHELGHTMHSYFSNKNQPFAKADYATFVAEIASTVNETLLNDYMVKNAKNDEEKLYLLGSYLDLLRLTIFRQTSFAEFEWDIHKKVEAGEPITGDDMDEIYYNIVKKYYGNDEGHCVVDDYI